MWKAVPQYEEYYECSDDGRIRSKDRIVTESNGKQRKHKGRTLAPTQNKNGYLLVPFAIDGKRQQKYVHRVVAETFISGIPSGYVVNHIDGDRLNDRSDNLEIISASENNLHSYRKLRRIANCHGGSNRRIVVENIITKQSLYFNSVEAASRELALSPTQIRRYLNSNSIWRNAYKFRDNIKCVEDIEMVSAS